MTATEPAGAARERLLWHVELGGSAHRIDLIPAAIGHLVTLELDGRLVGRVPKPTPQHPWREAAFHVGGEVVLVALIWHVPVMQTDVFVGGRSVRDSRTHDAARAVAPVALSNYETWIGGVFRNSTTAWHPSRRWAVAVFGSVLVWALVLALEPFPPELRVAAGVGLAVSGAFLTLAFVWSMSTVSLYVHKALLAQPSWGDWRVILWWVAFVGYAALGVVVVGLVVAIAAG